MSIELKSREASTRTVAVVHPGVQHSADLAAALNASGDLALLLTGLQIGVGARGLWSTALAVRLVPRRIHPSLPDHRIGRVAPIVIAATRLLRRFPALDSAAQRLVNDKVFARRAATRIPLDVKVVIGTDYASGTLFKYLAKSRPDVIRILDVSHPSDEVRQRLVAEDSVRWNLQPEAYDDYAPRVRFNQRAEFELADHVVVASDFSAQWLPPSVGADRVSVIPYGLTPPPSGRVVAPSRPRVLFVGALSERKGLSHLLRAAEHLSSAADIDLVGQVAGAYQLPRQLPSNVHFHGPVSRAQLVEMYRRASLLVLPSMCEGFGRVLLEALAHGVPVLTTTSSGGPTIRRLAPDAPVTSIDLDELPELAAHILVALETPREDPKTWMPSFLEAFSEVRYARDWSALIRGLQNEHRTTLGGRR